MRLEGKRALITGGGSGIGRALALAGAARGMRLALTGRRASKLRETLEALPGSGHIIIPADVTKAENREELTAGLTRAWGGLDILVNNAGVVPGGPLAAVTDGDLQTVLDTNLLAPMALTRGLLPLLRRGKSPRVVNMGSLLGEIPYPLFAAYSASKAGLAAFSTALRRELAAQGIGVTHAAPRATRTSAAKPFENLAEPFGMNFDEPRTVARAVWEAVAAGRNTVWPAGPERFFVLVQKLFPRIVDRATARQMARAMRSGSNGD